MDLDDEIAQFTAITSATPQQAIRYLELSENNLESAIQLFFDSPDLATDPALAAQPDAASIPAGQPRNPIMIGSDDEDDDADIYAPPRLGATPPPRAVGASAESDEEMARRLQQEFYGGPGRGAGPGLVDEDGVRAPIARTTEQLVGPGAHWGGDVDDVQAAVMEQMRRRAQARHRTPANRPGIFNQRNTATIWNEATSSSAASDPAAQHQRDLSLATGGMSEASRKSNMLAELFRPPFDLMFYGSWDDAREMGKDEEKWLLVNVQDSSVFDCQVLNRDIWKNEHIRETVRENFVFLQYNKDDPHGQTYIDYYFPAHDSTSAYPHIAIVDPRTGEQVKVWSGPPVPKPEKYLNEMHEFLGRYSLKADARNPVAKRKPEKAKTVDRMTEEEMLEMALANSLEGGSGTAQVVEDPDALTRSGVLTRDKGKARAQEEDTAVSTGDVDMENDGATNGSAATNPFDRISSSNAHAEPANDPATTTRIQFRHSEGRIVRRFAANDPVYRLYEWLKAEPLRGKEGQAFELRIMGKDLINSLDMTIAEAGLKNGTIMIEFDRADE